MGGLAGAVHRATRIPANLSAGALGALGAPGDRRARGSARAVLAVLAAATILGTAAAAPPGASAASAATARVSVASNAGADTAFVWRTVVNNGDTVPGDTRVFNSYNQPSLNIARLVVFRARSQGGIGEPAHGVFTRDMGSGGALATILDRKTAVPDPNNLGTTFIEPPSFPRIDMRSSTVASRGNHQPVWAYQLSGGTDTRGGTTGIYTNPFGGLITGMSNLGPVADYSFFAVPRTDGLRFDVFPGAPAVTDGATVVFKGNFTDADGAAQTGAYYRNLSDADHGGDAGAIVIADTRTPIPGTKVAFGSVAPPSAAGRQAVFAGFDDEDSPSKGGIYLAQLTGGSPKLKALVTIGQAVPGERSGRFNRIGEGLSFDGRFVAFWGAWGTATRTLVLQCPTEGNKLRIAYCKSLYPGGYKTTVPVSQGIFVYDTSDQNLYAVAKAPKDFADFVYWNFSGRVPGSSEGDTGEPARWRSASFVAVSGLVDGTLRDANFHAAFKARQGQVVDGAYVSPADGIYLRKGPRTSPLATVVKTGMDGGLIDPEAPGATTGAATVTEMGLERDGFRGDALAVNVSMGAESSETGWAGIYLTTVPQALR